MNRDEAREKMIDLLYGELPADQAAATEAAIAADPELAGELAALRRARAAVARYRAGEPADAVVASAATVRAGRDRENAAANNAAVAPSRAGVLRRYAALGAIAASVLLAVGIVLFMLGKPPVVIAAPLEIRRESVSLTILSEPENWGGWSGLALVRDQRLAVNLATGVAEVTFTDVPAGIRPDTVRLRSLDRDDGMTILEQNYQYDLATADAILTKYVDRAVSATFAGGGSVAGRLLSFDRANIVLQPEGEGPRTVTRNRLADVRLAELPKGLLTTPTLLWRVRNNLPAPRHRFEVAYMTAGLAWRADYVLKLHPAQVAPAGEAGAIIDSADLVGYATVSNLSGVTYANAQLKLMAGDVNLIRPPVNYNWYYADDPSNSLILRYTGPGFQEKSFFEYHLYTLGRAVTLADQETKQIELVAGAGLKLARGYVYDPDARPSLARLVSELDSPRGYVYDPDANASAARVVSELDNSEKNGLGKPLPKGVLRLYAPDGDGVPAYVAQTTIDHTPKDEKLRLPWGYAFDIACSSRTVAAADDGDNHTRRMERLVRNHKDHAVTVTAVARVPATTTRFECKGYKWRLREVGLVEIDVPVAANKIAIVDFVYAWNNRSGGGLKSP